MSTPRSSRSARIRIERIALGLVLSALALPAWALQTDRQQMLNVYAPRFEAAKDPGISRFWGGVRLDQGSLKGDAAQATAYTNADNKITRVVLEGTPAHLSQRQDDGSTMQAQAQRIDYTPDTDTVILTGAAQVVQPGHGSFQGERLVYNTQTGAMQGESAAGGEVHVTFQPRPKPSARVPAAAASAGKTAGEAPAPAASSGKPGGGSR
ncbi:MAG: lipopolysaccharide transport periplasmic protein LptA [Xanthomonadaceae bacterium]|nr:lipopolysaccharide transport periplasmic protein LptA [Xanthomonadaceae bacterium]MDE2177282.1 lipopolysaccharide transport periplasmic protein LptA [Xanthomonadaceae bacterium]